LSTWIKGIQVSENGVSQITRVEERPLNHFHCRLQQPQDFELTAKQKHIRDGIPVIVALEGQLITLREQVPATTQEGKLCSNTETDVLKLVVVNRYREAVPAVAFIKNFGFKKGAIASSVAHDSHNIVAVGVEDESICAAINLVIEQQGGLSCVGPNRQKIVGLPVAGLMSAEDGYQVAAAYTEIDQLAKSLGTQLAAPFMTLSFMALLVIPHLKLSDKGLFDGDGFSLMEI
ncbi:MAG: adenine deaminase C-terminal domain-containing protein, partial [Chitinophagaceae bacterium]